MRNFLNPYLIISLLVAGTFFELLKSAKLKNRPDTAEIQGLTDLDLQPYSRQRFPEDNLKRQKPLQLTQFQGDGVQKNNRFEGQPDLNEKPVQTAEGNNSQGTTNEQKNIAKLNELAKKATADIEKKKKAADAIKAKNKKNKEAADKENKEKALKQIETGHDSDRNDHTDETDPNESTGGLDANTQKNQPILPESPEKEKAEVPGVEEWIRRVLNQPSLEETTNLINYRNSNLISPEVFYTVVNLMLEDSRLRMRELGVHAVNATPGYRSFVILAQFLQDESHGSSVRSSANQAFDRYAQFPYLPVIESVVRSQEATPVREKAINLVVNSANLNLNKKSTPSPAELSEQKNKNPMVKRYSDLLAGLELLLTKSAEPPQIRAALQNAVDELKKLLAPVGT
ncbi:MAG: hypothetical protein IPJ71_08760 [Bdellovibrionales bacterium]|nr:hypothetical protein [Bdellovibrionales bacterium]